MNLESAIRSGRTEIVDPLDTTVVRLGRFVDRLPGSRRTQRSTQP